MNAQLVYSLALTLSVSAVAVVLLQWLWLVVRRGYRVEKRIARRMAPLQESDAPMPARVDLGPLERVLLQADIHWSLRKLVVLTISVVGCLSGVAVSNGLVVFLVTAFFVGTAVFAWWWSRFQTQRRLIHEHLPGTLDAVLRNLEAGRSLEQALISSFGEAPSVFVPLVFRMRNAVEAGREYSQLFVDFSDLYRVPALVQVAIALRTSTRFGASIKPVLKQVASSLRSQQEMRQEFLAATAETRFTAITFAVLPPGLAAYMVLVNRDYSEVLLNTTTGHTMLTIAGILQMTGMLVIWRMIQGVGRE